MEERKMKKLIRKIFMTMLVVGILSVASNSFAWWNVDYVVNGDQVIPAEYTISYLWMPDTFYNDFTK